MKTWNSGTPGAKKMKMSYQRISPAPLSASKYKSDSKEQQIKDEALAKRNVCMGLRVAADDLQSPADEDFDFMMETMDREVTDPKVKNKKRAIS